MSDREQIAANDTDGPPPAGDTGRVAELRALQGAIEAARTEADRLALPMIGIHLDHADALCLGELAKHGAAP